MSLIKIGKLYVSGPMTGKPDFNRAAFDEARPLLEATGLFAEIVDPVSEDIRVYGSWEAAIARPWQEHLARDIVTVPTCDAIALLDGWESSSGANLELRVALALQKPAFIATIHELPSGQKFVVLEALEPDAYFGTVHPGDVASPPPLEATERSRATSNASMVDDTSYDASYDDSGRFVPYSEDPSRHVFTTGGVKDNRGKPTIDLVPTKPLVAIAKVLAFGAEKYKPHNWRRGLPWPDTYSSLQRHLLAWNDGEDLDPETGESHLAHAGCQLMFLLDYVLTGVGKETDNRWGTAKSDAESLTKEAPPAPSCDPAA